MKKFLYITSILFALFTNLKAECVNDRNCVYTLNTRDFTATVVNFCNTESIVTIPSSITYLGDEYIVKGISYNSFFEDYDSEYHYYNYELSRSKIKELNLPTTIKELGMFAFSDLTRLRKLVIPANIKELTIDRLPFYNNDQIETITFNGLTSLNEVYVRASDGFYDPTTLHLADDALFFQDTLLTILKKYCVNLQSIELPHAQKIIEQQKLISQYNQKLIEIANEYNQQLKENPYNITNRTISPLLLSYKEIEGTNQIEPIFTQLKNEMEQKYKVLSSQLEQDCKAYYPEKYAVIYCSTQPEIKERLENLYHNYKCTYTKEQIATFILENTAITDESCPIRLYREYHSLFESKDEFLQIYELEDYKNIIDDRHYANAQYIAWLIENKKVYFLDCKVAYPEAYNILIKAMKKAYGNTYQLLIDNNARMNKEFKKNGVLFASPKEFVESYISGRYKTILDSKKK